MSKLDELIKELCPNGVEYKKLGEVCNFQNGFAFKSALFKENGEAILRITNISNGVINEEDLKYFLLDDYKENLDNYIVSKNDIVIAMSGATTGKIGINNTSKKFYLNQRVGKFIPDTVKLNNRFLYHFLLSKSLEILKISSGSGAQPNLSTENIKSLVIPAPPLEVQKEIEKILDNYTKSVEGLKEKLNEELIARKNQYSWYRDYLLKFENKVEIVKLKNIATEMYRGSGIKREEVRETGIPCVRYGEIYTDYGISFEKTKSYTDENLITNKKYIDYGDILFAITGESVEEIGKSTAYIGKEKCLVGGDILVMKHKQDPVYLSYVLSTENVQKQKSKGKIKSKVVHTNATNIGEIEIPLPPLEVQKRIVEVLNNFEKICNNLNIGLSAEIEARQKQYEFYRNFLLTFKIENCTLPKTRQDKTRQDKT
ncbi:restriction endonuclease subunit S [Fusobacterium animalis]|uniref:restriction endonuclease subunit S n=1 Tax=Fusobacterium animalis TaxID=76859 RepID=UPI0030CACBF8